MLSYDFGQKCMCVWPNMNQGGIRVVLAAEHRYKCKEYIVHSLKTITPPAKCGYGHISCSRKKNTPKNGCFSRIKG